MTFNIRVPYVPASVIRAAIKGRKAKYVSKGFYGSVVRVGDRAIKFSRESTCPRRYRYALSNTPTWAKGLPVVQVAENTVGMCYEAQLQQKLYLMGLMPQVYSCSPQHIEMEYVRGMVFRYWLLYEANDPSEVLYKLGLIAYHMGYCASQGILLRDRHFRNIMVAETGELVHIDAGLCSEGYDPDCSLEHLLEYMHLVKLSTDVCDLPVMDDVLDPYDAIVTTLETAWLRGLQR